MKDILVINSYGGSLLLGAKAAGYPIRGSYEDTGFGMEAQKLNFPDLDFKAELKDWPQNQALEESVVIAHPPCAPFSIMNPMKGQEKYQGTEADGFQCHRQVMEYSLKNHCQALAIESVPGALKAQTEYQVYATKYGYDVYFLKVNSISFGVPQWRPRVWVVFIRNTWDESRKFGVNLTPTYTRLSSILQAEGTVIDEENHITVRHILEKGTLEPTVLQQILAGEHGTGTLLQLVAEFLEIEPTENFKNIRDTLKIGGIFAAMTPRVLNPESWAPTILAGCYWLVNGRPLLLEEYNQIMGFPADYKWPDEYRDPRLYLSKGVCPPVATWILNQISDNLEQTTEGQRVFYHYCDPGGVLDLCPKPSAVQDVLDGKPAPEPKQKKERKARAAKEPATPIVRTRSTSSDLAAKFLASLRKETK